MFWLSSLDGNVCTMDEYISKKTDVKLLEIMGMADHNVSNYELYVRKTAESIGCKVLSDRFVKLNGMNVEKLLQRCGMPVEGKSITYTLSSGKYIIFVGLKGHLTLHLIIT